MKKRITLAIILFSSSVLADPSIFGMEIGTMTEKELQSMYSVTHTGTNKYSNGNMYSVPVSAINFDGLKNVTTIFNKKGELVAVLTTLPKKKFDYINKNIGGKYKLVSKKIPFVGDKTAKYRDGATEISLSAPHMSFDMSLNYINDELLNAFNKQSKSESKKKEANEASQL